MVVSFLTLAIGNDQGMDDVQCAQMQDFYVPRKLLQIYDGPSKSINDLWGLLGRDYNAGGFIAGAIIKTKLGLSLEPFAEVAYQFWLGGDFIKNDEPQGTLF
jgi:ribulose-bisphosphate carboxylase large chain